MILVVCQHETGDTAHWPPLVIRNLCERLVFSLASPNSPHRRDNQPYCIRTLRFLLVPLSRTHPYRNSAGHQRGRWECHPSLFSIGHLNHIYHLQSFRGNRCKVQWRIISLTLYKHYIKTKTNCQVFLREKSFSGKESNLTRVLIRCAPYTTPSDLSCW